MWGDVHGLPKDRDPASHRSRLSNRCLGVLCVLIRSGDGLPPFLFTDLPNIPPPFATTRSGPVIQRASLLSTLAFYDRDVGTR